MPPISSGPYGPVPVIRIEPSRGWVSLRLGELWEYRELLYFLTWRDIKVRYAQASMGVAWAVLQPLANMVVFTLLLSRIGKVSSDGIAYPLDWWAIIFNPSFPYRFAHMFTAAYLTTSLVVLAVGARYRSRSSGNECGASINFKKEPATCNVDKFACAAPMASGLKSFSRLQLPLPNFEHVSSS